MLNLKQRTDRIHMLVEEGSAESLTFAALLCRLALEAVCYERLRNAHDYIAAGDLKRWQPSYVINQLLQEVEPHIASDCTISISTTPAPTASGLTTADFEGLDYVQIGRQSGFDSKKLGQLWNALGSFLHARIPLSREEPVEFYGKAAKLTKKIAETTSFLRGIDGNALILDGSAGRISFECTCGRKNSRRPDLINDGQVVSCLDPECDERWTVEINEGEVSFARRLITLNCSSCSAENIFVERKLQSIRRDQAMKFWCVDCNFQNEIAWRLVQIRQAAASPGVA